MYKKKLLFWSACNGMLFFGIGLITLGSVVPGLKQKYLLDEISSGTLFSILPFGILAGSLLFGPLCDRYGYKILMAFSCFLMFLGFEGIAYAPSLILLKVVFSYQGWEVVLLMEPAVRLFLISVKKIKGLI